MPFGKARSSGGGGAVLVSTTPKIYADFSNVPDTIFVGSSYNIKARLVTVDNYNTGASIERPLANEYVEIYQWQPWSEPVWTLWSGVSDSLGMIDAWTNRIPDYYAGQEPMQTLDCGIDPYGMGRLSIIIAAPHTSNHCNASKATCVDIPKEPGPCFPIAAFTWATDGEMGVQFYNNSYTPAGTEIFQYQWYIQVESGGYWHTSENTTNIWNPYHQWSTPGTYRVYLKVVNRKIGTSWGDQLSNVTMRTVTVPYNCP